MLKKFSLTAALALLSMLGNFFVPSSLHAYAIINLNTLSADTSIDVDVMEGEVGDGSVDKVIVRHKQKGALLAIFPVTFTAVALAYPDGRVELRYPWFSALTLDNKREIEDKAKIVVDNTLKSSLVGSVKAQGESEKQSFSKAQAKAIEVELRKVLREAFENWGEDVDE